MVEKTNHHMTSDEFREAGRELVDWIADYYDFVENRPWFRMWSPATFARDCLRIPRSQANLLTP